MLIGGSSRCVPSIRAPPPPARGHSLPCRPGLLRDSDSIDASHGLARGAHHPAQAERPAQPDAAHQGQDRSTRAIAPPRILPALCIRLSLPVGGCASARYAASDCATSTSTTGSSTYATPWTMALPSSAHTSSPTSKTPSPN